MRFSHVKFGWKDRSRWSRWYRYILERGWLLLTFSEEVNKPPPSGSSFGERMYCGHKMLHSIAVFHICSRLSNCKWRLSSSNIHETERDCFFHLVNVYFLKTAVIIVRNLTFKGGDLKQFKILSSINSGMRPPNECVRMMKPSKWANYDVSSFNFYSDVYEHPYFCCPEHLTIELTTLVQNRAAALGSDHSFLESWKSSVCPTEAGDTGMFLYTFFFTTLERKRGRAFRLDC